MTITEPAQPAEVSEQVDTIGRKAGRGLRWTLVGTLATKVGSFAMGIVLAHLLAPGDFGLYAIALAATQFVMHVNDVGVIAACVQWRGKFEDMAPTAATLSVLFSVAWYALFWVAAPSFAELAGSADAAPLVRLLTAVILIDGITAVRVAALQRRFQHGRLMAAITSGFVANATLAITLAANGAGPYSFVYGQLAASVVTGVLMLLFAGMPLRYRLDRAVARRLVKFGLPLAVGLGIESVLLYADSVIVGNQLGAVILGFYLLAFNVSSWVPGLVTTAVRYVSIAGFSRLAEDREETLRLGVRRAIPVLISAILPVAVTVGVLAPALVVFLYGETWAPAAQALRLLAVVMIARVFTSFAFDILTSVGATRSTVWLNLGWAVTLIPALLVGTQLGGIEGAAAAHAVIGVLVAIPLAVLFLQKAGLQLRSTGPALVRPLAGAAASASVMVALSASLDSGPLAELTVAGGLGLLVYVLIVVPREQLRRALAAITRARPRTADAVPTAE